MKRVQRRRRMDSTSLHLMFLIFTTSTVQILSEKYAEYEKMTHNGQITHFKTMKSKRPLEKDSLLCSSRRVTPWITFKDPCNVPLSSRPRLVSSTTQILCTEITLNTSAEETAVCNLGSVNLARHMKGWSSRPQYARRHCKNSDAYAR